MALGGEMTCCATSDCGRVECRVCKLARHPLQRSASTEDPMREDARADYPVKKRVDPMKQKRHRGWI